MLPGAAYWIAAPPSAVAILGLIAALLIFFTVTGQWALWLIIGVVVTLARFIVSFYQVGRIVISLNVLLIIRIYTFSRSVYVYIQCLRRGTAKARSSMLKASTYADWYRRCKYLEDIEGVTKWRERDSESEAANGKRMVDLQTVKMMLLRVQRDLSNFKSDENAKVRALVHGLPGFLKRNVASTDSHALHSRSLIGTLRSVEELRSVILTACDKLANYTSDVNDNFKWTAKQKKLFFERIRLSYGRSALCLSGGGSLAMYHLGVVKAMLDSDCLPRVISGTSGGSIVAGMLAIKTREELISDIIQPNIAEIYLSEGISFFPPIVDQIKNFIKTRFLVSSAGFERTCRRYFGTYTFGEGFRRTKRIVNISVTLSGSSEKILLNHVTSPNVYIWSAVAASCALPGIMAPVPLITKGINEETGEKEDFEFLMQGQAACDGSILADIPRKRMSELFGVTNFIVSQVNPHVAPFLRSEDGKDTTAGGHKHPLSSLEAMVHSDVRQRCQLLSKLGLFPRIYGQRIDPIFRQKYLGKVTIVPRFGISDSFKAIQNPTPEHMRVYLLNGARATWPKISFIKHLTCIEKKIYECLEHVRKEARKEGQSNNAKTKMLPSKVVGSPVHYGEEVYDAEDDVLTVSPLNIAGRFSVGSDDATSPPSRLPAPRRQSLDPVGTSSMQALQEQISRLKRENARLRRIVMRER